MGSINSKMLPLSFYLIKRKNIVNKHELASFITCIQFLKDNHRFPGLFLSCGSMRPIHTILQKIRKGDPQLAEHLYNCCTPRQCATALMVFLKARNRPLLPNRVQDLLLAQNVSITPSTIASDALGLLRQDIRRNHLHLLYAFFDLLRTLSTVGSLRPTELHTSCTPQLIMPILFKHSNQKAIHANWHNITYILYEMIMHVHLIQSRPIESIV